MGWKKTLQLSLGLVIIIQFGALLTEYCKAMYASKFQYEASHSGNMGRLVFLNAESQDPFKQVKVNHYIEYDVYSKSPEWQALLVSDQKDHAQIELFGKIIVLLISTLGLGVYFTRRNRKKKFSGIDFASLGFGFFYLKELVLSIMNFLLGRMNCNEAKIWQFWEVNPFNASGIIALGLFMLTAVIFYYTPKSNIPFILTTLLIGGTIGGLIWLLFVGELLLL